MATTTTTLTYERYPTPPPTLNNLPREQRARLIRSARKLGAVLGTTPLLFDPATATVPATATAPPNHPYAHAHSHSVPTTLRLARPPRERRHGSIFTMPVAAPPSPTSSASPSPASSRTSLSSDTASSAISTPRTSIESFVPPPAFSSKAGRRSASPPRPLILHLTAIPLSPSDPRVPTPRTACTMEHEPTTPRTPTPADRAEARRRKMAKLARTLGESVPPELVFGADEARRASEEDIVQPDELLAFAKARARGMHAANAPAPAVTLANHTMSMRTGSSVASLPCTRAPTPAATPRPPRVQTPAQQKAKTHRRRSMSLSALPTPAVEAAAARVGQAPGGKRRTPVFASGARAPRGERWVGAWNRRDIHQVQRELRQLKAR